FSTLLFIFSIMLFMSCFSFFVSSRRRHTISKRDWSSDVCSSDLVGTELLAVTRSVDRARLVRYAGASGDFNPIHWNERFALEVEIGRASCRERVLIGLGAASVRIGLWDNRRDLCTSVTDRVGMTG